MKRILALVFTLLASVAFGQNAARTYTNEWDDITGAVMGAGISTTEMKDYDAAGYSVSNEPITVPASADADGFYRVMLTMQPRQGTLVVTRTSGSVVLTQVAISATPGANEVGVDWQKGVLRFPATAAGVAHTATFTGNGSVLLGARYNQLQKDVSTLNTTGTKGAASSTNRAIVLFTGTTGKEIQNQLYLTISEGGDLIPSASDELDIGAPGEIFDTLHVKTITNSDVLASDGAISISSQDGTAAITLDNSAQVGVTGSFLGTDMSMSGVVSLGAATLTGASPLVFEGSTSNTFETSLAVTDPTVDRTITLPNATGTVPLLESANVFTAAQAIDTASPLSFEGATADAFETSIAVTDPTADRTITIPNATGTVALVGGPLISGYRALGDAGTTLVPATDCVVTFAPSGDTRTLTLASATAGQHFFVKNLTGSADNVDFTGGNIDGAAASAYGPIGSGVTIHLLCIGTTDFITLND